MTATALFGIVPPFVTWKSRGTLAEKTPESPVPTRVSKTRSGVIDVNVAPGGTATVM